MITARLRNLFAINIRNRVQFKNNRIMERWDQSVKHERGYHVCPPTKPVHFSSLIVWLLHQYSLIATLSACLAKCFKLHVWTVTGSKLWKTSGTFHVKEVIYLGNLRMHFNSWRQNSHTSRTYIKGTHHKVLPKVARLYNLKTNYFNVNCLLCICLLLYFVTNWVCEDS